MAEVRRCLAFLNDFHLAAWAEFTRWKTRLEANPVAALSEPEEALRAASWARASERAWDALQSGLPAEELPSWLRQSAAGLTDQPHLRDAYLVVLSKLSELS